KFPYLIYEKDNQVLGYAYADVFRNRAAYDWSAETSVYVRGNYHGQGIGKALYGKLLPMLKEQGIVNVLGAPTIPNDGSIKLHEHFGFVQVATFKNIGFKLGRWWDVGFWQLQFDRPEMPQPRRAP